MSAFRQFHLQCDHPGCDARLFGARDRADETRVLAAKIGWSHRIVPRPHGGTSASMDLCAVHVND